MLPRCLAVLLLWSLTGFCAQWTADEPDTTADEQALRAAHLPTEGSGLLTFFRQRTPDADTRNRVTALIRQMGSDSFSLREKATVAVIAVGMPAAGLLRKAANESDLEIRWRARKALADIQRRDVSVETLTAALRVLSHRKERQSAEVMLEYLPYAEDADVADEIERVLASVAASEGQAHPVLVRALSDKVSLKRSAAGVALCRAGCRAQLPAIRRLLGDDDPLVRQRIALALVEAHEKTAIPVLIGLLAELPRSEAEHVESVLLQLAGDAAPNGNLEEKAARTRYRDAWQDWWTRHGESLDMASIELSQRWRGHMLAVCFASTPRRDGCIIELDARGKTRWHIADLCFPIDAQVLDARRVLVTEYSPGQVTERNHKGEILRRINVPDFPLAARRLPNGHTFITTRSRVIEVDRDGKETTWAEAGNARGMIVAACPLRRGEIGICYRTGDFARIDRSGTVLATFRVGRMFRPYGTHIQGLPNGHILVPLYYDNKVVEFDGDGREIWSATYGRPTSAQRLPNGRTLVASYGGNIIAELDAKGKEVKSIRCEGRIMCVQGR